MPTVKVFEANSTSKVFGSTIRQENKR